MQNAAQVATLLRRVISNQKNLIEGHDALSMLAAIDSLNGANLQQIERQSLLSAGAKRDKLAAINVQVRGLSFAELYASFDGAKAMDLSTVDTTLTVYYGIDYSDSERPEFYVQHIVTTAPIVFAGECCEHTIFAAIDVMPDMCEHRKRAIRDEAEELMVADAREAA